MKKILALVLALVLALSMAVSAFAADFFVKLEDHIGTGTQLAPTLLLVNGHGRIKVVLFIGQANGVGRAFHQQVIHVKCSGQAVFSGHTEISLRKG